MKRDFAYTAVSVGSRLLVGLLLFLLLARLWGPEQFGLFSFVFGWCALLVLGVDFGFSLYLLREVSACPAEAARLIEEAFRAKILMLGGVLVAALVSYALAGEAVLPMALALPLLLAALAVSFAEFFVAPLRALGRYEIETLAVTVSNAVHFALAASIAWHGGGLAAVAWGMVASRVLFMGISFVATQRLVNTLKLRKSPSQSPLALLRRIWPYGLDNILATAWMQMDVVIVRMIFGTQAVGLYSAGQRIVLGVAAIIPVMGNVMIPKLSALAARRGQEFWRMARKTGGLMAILGICFAAPLITFPSQITAFLFGAKYQELAQFLPWFGGIILIRYCSAAAGVVATSLGLQIYRVLAQILGLSVAAILTTAVAVLNGPMSSFLAAWFIALSVVGITHFWNVRFRSRRLPQ